MAEAGQSGEMLRIGSGGVKIMKTILIVAAIVVVALALIAWLVPDLALLAFFDRPIHPPR